MRFKKKITEEPEKKPFFEMVVINGIFIIRVNCKTLGIGDVEQNTKNISLFKEKINEISTHSYPKVIINLANVEKMNSVWLGVLIDALTTMVHKDGKLVLCNIENIEEILRLTKLYSVFPHADDEQWAMRLINESNR